MVFKAGFVPALCRGVQNQMPPEGGRYKLGKVTHLSALGVSVGTLNLVEKVVLGGSDRPVGVLPGHRHNGARAMGDRRWV